MLSSLTQVLTKPADGKAEDGKLAEIPIPEIRKVATYERDYRPHHRASRTYLRNRTFGAPPTDVVEYDLDNEDEDWLTAYNDGQNRLPAEKFEAMIWKLEVCCGEATETAMELRAAVATEKGQIISYQDKCAAMAGTEALPKEKALELRRQRRSSAAPVAGPFAAHSSFRRDDRIHTDFRAHVLDTASEMAAGEHLAAAYRLRDSVGANATLAAGLRRFSHAAGKAPGGGAFCRTSSAAAPCELDSIALAGLRGSATASSTVSSPPPVIRRKS